MYLSTKIHIDICVTYINDTTPTSRVLFYILYLVLLWAEHSFFAVYIIAQYMYNIMENSRTLLKTKWSNRLYFLFPLSLHYFVSIFVHINLWSKCIWTRKLWEKVQGLRFGWWYTATNDHMWSEHARECVCVCGKSPQKEIIVWKITCAVHSSLLSANSHRGSFRCIICVFVLRYIMCK